MAVKKHFLSVDGNTAAALASYNFTEVAGIYPITPSSGMAELVDVYASKGKLNFFNNIVKVVEMQSEGGAAAAVHGALQGGALATSYTASQGLLLMIPNIYKWCGELLPAVLHVSARSIASRSLSIFGDHQDIYAVRQTGISIVSSHSVQEVADLAPLAHLLAIDAHAPVIHFFDGFRTSHEIQNIEIVDDEEWKKLLPLDKLEKFRARALNPHTHPITRGGAENDDIYFQGREAQNKHYAEVLNYAEHYFKKASELTGRHYAPFTYYGDENATDIVIAMGSVTETIKEVVDHLRAEGRLVGLVKVHLYRPFSGKHLVSVLPKSVKRIAVLDRTKEMGAPGEPLYLDVVTALHQEKLLLEVYGGRYGLSSKNVPSRDIKAVYDSLIKKPHHNFTIGIVDDVTNLSLEVDPNFHTKNDYTSSLFYGLGSDGTVSANRSSIKIIGDATGQYAQAYFQYDSRKAGGVTRSHLRFGKSPIRSTYFIDNADFISCSMDTYVVKYDMLKNLKENGTFLLNTDLDDESLIALMPNRVKHQLAMKKAKFYVIDANKIAREIGLGRHTNTILQASFFYLNQTIMPYDEAVTWMKKLVLEAYGTKGEEIVNKNNKAIDEGTNGLREIKVDPQWVNLPYKRVAKATGDDYFDHYVDIIGALDGDILPVSKFLEYELVDGTMENNITFKEKRSIADYVPRWIKEKCIQCNMCAFVCPHATIRGFLINDEELEKAPQIVKDDVLNAMGGPSVASLKFKIQVSTQNCVGCGLCVAECLANKSGRIALEMVEAKTQYDQEEGANYLFKEITYKSDKYPLTTVKGVAFLMPYMEVSGACAGCGETPYYRLVTQLFGRDMMVANATGCTSIYCGSTPLTPFVKDKQGEGIAWANSLFEDNAEFGFGMRLATDTKLARIAKIIEDALIRKSVEEQLKEVLKSYLENIKKRDEARVIIPNLIDLVKASKDEEVKELLTYERDLLDKSIWIIGGDGWAYDIGYGGLDHVLANYDDVNVLVLDTEVYSNTGGQSSKSSQAGSIAKFTASGKTVAKKNLALMAMTYGHVYVAQISLGGNPVKAIQALKEAESYDGPSLIIAYSPCIEHGIKGGLVNSIKQEKDAVESGYFTTFRYDPRRVAQGLPGLELDCKEPDFSKFRDFVMRETRFSQLPNINPENAEALLEKSMLNAKDRWEKIKKFGL
ncbi:MAG: pyruvate:ferredoxin (flavodoxin) oxidoreductase [Bacilli bacterium]|jgi:pyruvate-ferredoxin/flavodoxin oxidoreductase|nr:pyruvate:ferredoxin (flavodoxin) oxidoreductase [Erysipelotrichia bacterium]